MYCFQFVSIRGGFSNTLYRCSLPENVAGDPQVPKEVLLRIYGPIQEDPNLLVAGAVSFMLLSERRLGPKLYGLLPDGRLEEFIPVSSMHRMFLLTYYKTNVDPLIVQQKRKIIMLFLL